MAGKTSAAENLSYGDRSERIRWSRDDREIPETPRKENAACFDPFSMHPLRDLVPLSREKIRKNLAKGEQVL